MIKGLMLESLHYATYLLPYQITSGGKRRVNVLVCVKLITLLRSPSELRSNLPLLLWANAIRPMIRAEVVPARPSHHIHLELAPTHGHHVRAPSLRTE
jgi:hypothetical protein